MTRKEGLQENAHDALMGVGPRTEPRRPDAGSPKVLQAPARISVPLRAWCRATELLRRVRCLPVDGAQRLRMVSRDWRCRDPGAAKTGYCVLTEQAPRDGRRKKPQGDGPAHLQHAWLAVRDCLPPGYKNPIGVGCPARQGRADTTKGNAQDWQIIGPDGAVRNRGDDVTGLYTTLAKNAYGYQEKNYPELTGKFQWGGQFGTSSKNPNEPDLMHFDVGGRRGRISKYSRERIGSAMPADSDDRTHRRARWSVRGCARRAALPSAISSDGATRHPSVRKGRWVLYLTPRSD